MGIQQWQVCDATPGSAGSYEDEGGPWVSHSDHIADKAAALKEKDEQIEALKCAGFAAVFRLALGLVAPTPGARVKEIKAAWDAACAEEPNS